MEVLGWKFWNCPKTIADAVSSAWDWGFCVGKHMLPVNPDDVLALYRAWSTPGGAVGNGVDPARGPAVAIAKDAAKYAAEKFIETSAEGVAVFGIKKVVAKAFVLADAGLAVYDCSS